MYEIKSSQKEVNGKTVVTWIAQLVSSNMLEVEAGTTGYRGGDTGHGGRTYFRLKNLAGTDLEVNGEEAEEVIIELGGDCELGTFVDALEFTLQVLKEQIKEK